MTILMTKINFKHEIKPGQKLSDSDFINLLLKNRKIKDIKEFINPPDPSKITLSSFGFKKEINKTLKILKEIKEKNKMIVVYTDYDADGITGGAILWETLHLLGFKAMPYVPHRKNEGYGFSIKGIDNVKKLYDPALIISVDHGITGEAKIKYANSLGIKIIVTDHHLKPDKPPKSAAAVFHIPLLSGAGVAYFFAKEIYMSLRGPRLSGGRSNLVKNFETDYLALSAIGTIADMVPLIGPSRSLVKYGLEAFSKIRRHGLKHIIKEAGIEGKTITPYEVGFMIAPRINAVGRLEHAIDALRLLCTTDEQRAHKLACLIGNKNRERQDLVKESLDEAEEMLKRLTFNVERLKIITLISDHWHEGIIGLIASKIAEKYYRPTIVITKVDGFYKGSARSIPALDITKFLRDLKKYLIDVGGHKQAAGFSIEKDKLKNFVGAAEKKADKELSKKDLEKKIIVDFKVPISFVTLRVTVGLERLQPYGIGNPRPTFYSQAEIVDAKVFGKKNEHLKIFVKDPGSKDYPLELISFYTADKFLNLSRGQIMDAVYSLEVDRWGEREKVRGKLIIW